MLSQTAPYYALIYSPGTLGQGPGDFLHPAELLPYTCTSRARSCSHTRPETATFFYSYPDLSREKGGHRGVLYLSPAIAIFRLS